MSAFACCSRPALTVCGIRAVEAGLKKPAAAPASALQDRELPDVRSAAEEEDRGHALRADAREVGGDHHRPPREAVGPDAADERDGPPPIEVRRENDADHRRLAAAGRARPSR